MTVSMSERTGADTDLVLDHSAHTLTIVDALIGQWERQYTSVLQHDEYMDRIAATIGAIAEQHLGTVLAVVAQRSVDKSGDEPFAALDRMLTLAIVVPTSAAKR